MALDFSKEFSHIMGDRTLCSGRTKFWIPVVQGQYMPSTQKYKWLSDGPTKKEIYSQYQNWARSQPNGNGTQPCVGLMEDPDGKYLWNDLTCDKDLCFVCTTPQVQTYYLRGEGHYGRSKVLDSQYSLMIDMQQDEITVAFDGQGGKNQIVWNPSDQTSYLKRYMKRPKLQFKRNPFGYLKDFGWIFTNVSL